MHSAMVEYCVVLSLVSVPLAVGKQQPNAISPIEVAQVR